MNRKKHNLLIGILDWGLGHAARCIPIINELQHQGFNVIIGSNGEALKLLAMEYPAIEMVELPAYQPDYARNSNMTWTMLKQLPKFHSAIQKENEQLKVLIDRYQINVVLSDNRYGLHSDKIPCILLTHQIRIMIPKHLPVPKWVTENIFDRYFKHFTELWVPDFANSNNLSGKLSHGTKHSPIFIGPLSRFRRQNTTLIYDLLIMLSGPEPQRTIFENIVLKEISELSGKTILVRGTLGSADHTPARPNLVIKPLLPTEELNKIINQSKFIVCRSGYSSIMDLTRLQKNALLVPTPGQTEQEYLAEYMKEQGYFDAVTQENFSKKILTESIKPYDSNAFSHSKNLLVETIHSFKAQYFE